ncbi:PREDICTED: uncharacterized protein LOC108379420 [Rhagoletis zephyria]|uniref:uncharacterized protein LOC108379420 n=1 Tax=Rhagoletis zephyria TaxID=28612 RepID=UPI0008118C59|nr:PREDICTED: uncharacterized protein LOC108379420 [Rhagoletis zephyria]
MEKMALELQELGAMCTPSEIKSKMHNLTARCRKEKKEIGPSGGAPSKWPLYMEMHQLLAPYKSYNSETLVEESTNGEMLCILGPWENLRVYF